ncbi:hypothetical protein HK405_006501 [Cladochytrium tenue]|nr:hypothetical protein HK405_006501 [Cladochytrium tenue]
MASFTAADGRTPAVQDKLPEGMLPSTIQYRRSLPRRGPSGAVFFAALFGIMGYGWYNVALSNAERRELERERAWARIHLVPLLQAETDRDLVRRMESSKVHEAAVMAKARPDWSPLDLKAPVRGLGVGGVRDESQAEPVYYTQRYVPPSYFFIPKNEDIVKPQWWRGFKMLTKNAPYQDR